MGRWGGKHALGFTLLADADHAVAERYGAWVERSMYDRRDMGMQRATFVIEAAGVVARVFPRVSPRVHAGRVRRALRELAGPAA